jgi:hypothetical protein
MQVRRLALVALALVGACGGPLDRKRLYAAVSDLAAVAAETRMLVIQDHRGLPVAYAEGQRVDLANRGREALHELDRGVDDAALDPVRRRAAELGFRVTNLVATAHAPDALGAFAEQLERLAAETRP